MIVNVLAAVALLAPWTAAAVGAAASRSAAGAARAGAGIIGAGFLAAAGFAINAAVTGTPTPIFGAGAFVLNLDPLAVVMALLVLGLSAVIQSFGVRYLRGDSRQGWFVVTANLLTASTIIMVTAATVVVFVLGWLAAGVSLVLLLNTYAHDRQARDGVARTLRRFALGDAGLLVAAVILVCLGGIDLRLSGVGAVATRMPVTMGVILGLLLVLPALARSSQVPFQGWLPATLAAPTPVSALLHAGVVNAGAILLIRFSSAIAGSAPVMAVIFAVGAATVVYASAVRLTKPDVKGRLVFSTMAQMGFMIMACGLGAFAAAVFHLSAHGLYKSALFLSAGTGVRRAAAQRIWPERPQPTPTRMVAAIMLAVAVPLAAVVASRALFAPAVSAATLALLGFVVLSGAVTLGATLLVRLSVATLAIGFLGIAFFTVVYTAFVALFDTVLGGIDATSAVSAWWVLAPAMLLILTQWLASPAARKTMIHDLIYSRGLAAGSPSFVSAKGI